jgi:signal transduction histidine kinase
VEELRKIVCWSFVPENYREQVKQYYIQQVKKRQKSSYYEFPIQSRDGNIIWLGQSVDYAFDEKGMATRAFAIAKDMTEVKKAKEEQDKLLAVIAHDLRAPFSQIHLITELLSPELKGQALAYNEMTRKITNQSVEMINELMDVMAYEGGALRTEKKKIDLNTFFTTKMEAFTEMAKKKSISLLGSMASEPRSMTTDEGSLGRIVDNLISNAIKFSPEGKKVYFYIDQVNHNVRFTIQDEGPGFTEKDKQKVFQKFQKLSARPTGNEASTGLGLSIVKTLVEGLGGDIRLESESGKGAKFTVVIPKGEE